MDWIVWTTDFLAARSVLTLTLMTFCPHDPPLFESKLIFCQIDKAKRANIEGEKAKSYNSIKLLTKNTTDPVFRFYAKTMQNRPQHPIIILFPYKIGIK